VNREVLQQAVQTVGNSSEEVERYLK